MNDVPFPWNPNGYIKPELEHLFRPARSKNGNANRAPGSYHTPGPACQFTIGKPGAPIEQRKKKLLTRI